MSEQEFDPHVYDSETGDYVGQMASAVDDDGDVVAHVVVSPEGAVVRAIDTEGQPLNPGQFELSTPEPDPQAAELAARMEAVEQRLAEPPPPVVELPDTAGDDWRWRQQITREFGELERAVGRPLTDREQWELMADHHADHAAGRPADLWKSAGTVGLHDLNAEGRRGHEERVAFGVERLQDLDREARGASYDERPERRSQGYDTSTHQGRVDAAMDGLAGHDITDRTFEGE